MAKQKRDVDAIRNLAILANEGDHVARERFIEAVSAPSGGFVGPKAGRPSQSVDKAIAAWVG